MPLGTPAPRFPGLRELAAQAAAQLPPPAVAPVNPMVIAAQQYPGLAAQYPGLVPPTVIQPVVQQPWANARGYARQGFERGAARGVNRAANVAANQPLAAGTATQEARVANAFFPQPEPTTTSRPILGGNPAVREMPNVTSLRGDRVGQHMANQMQNIADRQAFAEARGLPAVASETLPSARMTAARAAAEQAAMGVRGSGAAMPMGAQRALGSGLASTAPKAAGLVDDAAMLANGGIPMTENLGKQIINEADKLPFWKRTFTPFGTGKFAPEFSAAQMGRSLGYQMAGQIGGGLFDSVVGERDGTWDDAASEAIRWAGTGAAMGTPFGPWGTAIGGGLGAIGGGLKGWLTGEDSPETQLKDAVSSSQEKFNKSLNQFGSISPELRNAALSQLQVGLAMAESPDQAKEVTNNVLSMVAQSIPADQAQQQDRLRRETLQASMQAWMGPMLQQAVAQQNFYAGAQSELLNEIAGQYSSPTMQGTTKALAASIPANTAMANQMLLAQIATTPALYGYSAEGPTVDAYADPAAITGAVPVAPQTDAFTQMLMQQMAQQQQVAAG